MNFYELMLIFSPALTEDEEKAQLSQVEETLKKEQATIHLMDHWGKRKLAYPIKKQRQGYYDWIYVEGEPARIAEVDRKLKMVEPLLRFMILRMEKVQIENLHREVARRTQAAEAPAAPSAESASPTEPITEETPAAVEGAEPAAGNISGETGTEG